MFYKCIKCELNYVKKPSDICQMCKDKQGYINLCMYCGNIAPENCDICQECKEQLAQDDETAQNNKQEFLNE